MGTFNLKPEACEILFEFYGLPNQLKTVLSSNIEDKFNSSTDYVVLSTGVIKLWAKDILTSQLPSSDVKIMITTTGIYQCDINGYPTTPLFSGDIFENSPIES